jgi:hypothetical protein
VNALWFAESQMRETERSSSCCSCARKFPIANITQIANQPHKDRHCVATLSHPSTNEDRRCVSCFPIFESRTGTGLANLARQAAHDFVREERFGKGIVGPAAKGRD